MSRLLLVAINPNRSLNFRLILRLCRIAWRSFSSKAQRATPGQDGRQDDGRNVEEGEEFVDSLFEVHKRSKGFGVDCKTEYKTRDARFIVMVLSRIYPIFVPI